MLNTISSLLPTLLGCVGLMVVMSDAAAPCGTRASRPAVTLIDHLSAIINHLRAIVAALIDRRSPGSGKE